MKTLSTLYHRAAHAMPALLMILMLAMAGLGCGLKYFQAQTPEGKPLSMGFQVAYASISQSERFYLDMYRDINSGCSLGLLDAEDCAKYRAMLEVYEGLHNAIALGVIEWYKADSSGQKYDKSGLVGLVIRIVPEGRKIYEGLSASTGGKASLSPPPMLEELMEVLIGSAKVGAGVAGT